MKRLRIHVLEVDLHKFVRTIYNSFFLKYIILNIKNLETILKTINK